MIWVSGERKAQQVPTGKSTIPTQSDAAATELDEVFQADAGRTPPYVQFGYWILLASISSQARDLFGQLAMHVNWERRKLGDTTVWPSMAALARRMGLRQGRSISQYLAELVELGAIEILPQKRNGMKTCNRYIVHFEPPPGYTGPRTLDDLDDHLGSETATESNRKTAGEHVVRSSAPRGDGDPVDNSKTAGEHVVRSSAPREVHVVRSGADPVVRSSAHELDEVLELKELKDQTRFASAPAHVHAREVPDLEPADDENQKTAYAVVDALPVLLNPLTRGQRDQLAVEIAERLGNGWTAQTLTDHLVANLGKDVRSWRMYQWRLTQLPQYSASAGLQVDARKRCKIHTYEWADPCRCCRSEAIAATG